jgi:D-alanine-D-alanine ligase
MVGIESKHLGKVAVLYGGTSAERDISLMSGKHVLQGLQDAGVDAHGIDVGDDIVQVLQAGQFDRVFNVLHGRGGEDGTIQALLEFLNIPYCGSGVAASSLSMDKARTKWVWQANDLPTPDFCLVKQEADILNLPGHFTYPLAVKPLHEGSSLGMSKVKCESELLPAFHTAKQYHDEVMVERWIEGGEYTVGIIGDTILPSVKISTPREFYDYEAKYFVNTTQYDCPSDLDKTAESQIANLARQAFDVLGCKDWARIDFIQNPQGQFTLIEANTVPGMTQTSLIPKAAKVAGITFPNLVTSILSNTPPQRSHPRIVGRIKE